MLEATGGAGLGSVPGINPDYPAALFLGLVGEERAQLGEAPAVEASLLGALLLPDSLPDARQVLDRDDATRSYGVYDLPTELVVEVAPEPKLFARETTKMSLRAPGAFSLKPTLEPEVPGFEFTPAALPEELVGGGDSGTNDAEIDTDDLAGCFDHRGGHVYHDVQPEPALAFDEVGGTDAITGVLGIERRQGEGHAQSTAGAREVDLPGGPIKPEGVVVVAGGARVALWARDLPVLVFVGEGGPDGFSGLHSCLDDEVRDEVGVFNLEGIVSSVVEGDAVALRVLESVAADRIEDSSELTESLSQGADLFGCGLQQQAHGSVHVYSLPYARRFCNRKEGGASFVG